MNLYDRQKTLQLNQNQTVTVIGCGGIGYWVAKLLAMSGIKKIILFDPDTLEDHNRNRLDVPVRFVGKNKTDIAKMAIESIRDDCMVYAFPFKYNDLADITDWVVDCTDNVKSQTENQFIAKKKGSRYFKAGYDGENFGIHNSVAEWGESNNGYTVVPSWSVPAIIIASLAVAKVMKYPDKEVVSSVPKLFRIDR
jgi:threonine dehydrogenase-like Zn-dependent dehydrogenase